MSNLLRLSFRRGRCRLPPLGLLPAAAAGGSPNVYSDTQFRRWSSKKEAEQQQDASISGPAAAPLLERSDKGFLSRLYDQHSLRRQTDRILVAESLLQAATSQASDP
jgi:hypothetical protein